MLWFHHLQTLERWYYTTQVIGLVFVIIGVAFAAVTWRMDLRAQRLDACLSAIIGWRASVHRVLSSTGNSKNLWQYHAAAWDAWTDFEKSFSVAQRYSRKLPNAWIENGINAMEALTELCKLSQVGENGPHLLSFLDKGARTIHGEAGNLSAQVRDRIRGTWRAG